MHPFTLRYRIWGVGWATISVTSGEVSRDMRISYIGPDINHLLWLTADLVAGVKDHGTIEFDGEGDLHTWQLARVGEDVRLHITSDIEGPWDLDSDEEAETDHWEYESTLPLRHFAQQVVAAFDQMMKELGEEGFKTKWPYETPALERRDELRALLEG
jgi:hypothetical protein